MARLTIEARVSGRLWFPERGSSGDRPWFGIVWSAKTDLGTWFDPAPESALGIQLLARQIPFVLDLNLRPGKGLGRTALIVANLAEHRDADTGFTCCASPGWSARPRAS